jgi:hypothetical protein
MEVVKGKVQIWGQSRSKNFLKSDSCSPHKITPKKSLFERKNFSTEINLHPPLSMVQKTQINRNYEIVFLSGCKKIGGTTRGSGRYHPFAPDSRVKKRNVCVLGLTFFLRLFFSFFNPSKILFLPSPKKYASSLEKSSMGSMGPPSTL